MRDPWMDVAKAAGRRRTILATEVVIEVMVAAKYPENPFSLTTAFAMALEWDRLLDLEVRMWAASSEYQGKVRREAPVREHFAATQDDVTTDVPEYEDVPF